jgi:hypothetical protein
MGSCVELIDLLTIMPGAYPPNRHATPRVERGKGATVRPPIQFGDHICHKCFAYRIASSITLKRPNNDGAIPSSRGQAHPASSEGERCDGLNMSF